MDLITEAKKSIKDVKFFVSKCDRPDKKEFIKASYTQSCMRDWFAMARGIYGPEEVTKYSQKNTSGSRRSLRFRPSSSQKSAPVNPMSLQGDRRCSAHCLEGPWAPGNRKRVQSTSSHSNRISTSLLSSFNSVSLSLIGLHPDSGWIPGHGCDRVLRQAYIHPHQPDHCLWLSTHSSLPNIHSGEPALCSFSIVREQI